MNKNRKITTRTLAFCALLAALSVVLARLIIPMPDSSTRFSIEAVPIFMAGMLFGPLAGGLVGFAADAVGTLFSGYGFNPLFCVPPIILGSILYQSFTLAYVYYYETFLEGLILKLTTRTVQFLITMVLDAVVINLLMKVGLFGRMGLWPPKPKEETR